MENLVRKRPTDLRTVYVSCGSQEKIQQYREMIEPLGYKVYDKWALLANDPMALVKIESLRFDEKAILEYDVLLNADFFLGVLMSSMSSLIAFARALNDSEVFFPTYVYPGSTEEAGVRFYPDAPAMKGNSKSKLMVPARGKDIMPYFP